MTLPAFIVIGAAKSGTSALQHDLASNPEFFVLKQPAYLGSDRVLTPEGRARFAGRFIGARPRQVAGLVSPMCSTRPRVDRVPERALGLLGRELRIIYLVRDPVERALSGHFDLARHGDATLNVDRELLLRPQFLDESRYAFQLEPWFQVFGADRVRVIHFETYVAKRRATIAELSTWLGAEPRTDLIDETRVENRGEDQLVTPWHGLWPPARRFARRFLPEPVKALLRRWAPRRHPGRPMPSAETLARVRELLREDTARFHEMLGLEEPLWGPGSRLRCSALLRPVGASLDSKQTQQPAIPVAPEAARSE